MDEKRELAPRAIAPRLVCQVCEAETRGNNPLCDSCSNAADTIADTPLPPIPDGGLSRAMPGWLRSAPHATIEATNSPQPEPNEFASILSDEDIPLWLKRMAERHAAENAPSVHLDQSTGTASPPIQTTSPVPAVAAPTALGRRVMVGASTPRPVEPSPTDTQRLRRKRMPSVEHRTAIGIGILVAIAAVVVLAVIFVG